MDKDRCELCDEFECTCWCAGCGLAPLDCICDFKEEDFKKGD